MFATIMYVVQKKNEYIDSHQFFSVVAWKKLIIILTLIHLSIWNLINRYLFIYSFCFLLCVCVFFYLLLFVVMKTVVCWSKLHAKLTHHAGSSYFFLALHTHKDDQLHHHIDIYESLLWLIYIVCTSIDSSVNGQVIQIKIIGESFFFFFHFLIFTI